MSVKKIRRWPTWGWRFSAQDSLKIVWKSFRWALRQAASTWTPLKKWFWAIFRKTRFRSCSAPTWAQTSRAFPTRQSPTCQQQHRNMAFGCTWVVHCSPLWVSLIKICLKSPKELHRWRWTLRIGSVCRVHRKLCCTGKSRVLATMWVIRDNLTALACGWWCRTWEGDVWLTILPKHSGHVIFSSTLSAKVQVLRSSAETIWMWRQRCACSDSMRQTLNWSQRKRTRRMPTLIGWTRGWDKHCNVTFHRSDSSYWIIRSLERASDSVHSRDWWAKRWVFASGHLRYYWFDN